jgi:chemotaxis response regulator CheB
VVVGASAGGVEALRRLVMGLPARNGHRPVVTAPFRSATFAGVPR